MLFTCLANTIYIYIYIYKIVDEESQNFIFTLVTDSFTRRTLARSSGDCQEDRIQILLYPNKNVNYLTEITKGKGKPVHPLL